MSLALEIQAELLMDRILEIADDGRKDWIASEDPEKEGFRVNHEVIRRARMRVENLKWLIIKLSPNRFGPVAAKKEEEKMVPFTYLTDLVQSHMRWEKKEAERSKAAPDAPAGSRQ